MKIVYSKVRCGFDCFSFIYHFNWKSGFMELYFKIYVVLLISMLTSTLRLGRRYHDRQTIIYWGQKNSKQLLIFLALGGFVIICSESVIGGKK